MADSQERINISTEVAAICLKLGLEPPFTKSIHLTPTQAEVVTYLKDAKGQKYTEPAAPFLAADEDDEVFCFSSTPLTATRTYEVRT
jgi:uncharacterized protein (DUF697 family)